MIAVPAVGAAVVAALPAGRDRWPSRSRWASALRRAAARRRWSPPVAFDAGGDRFQLTTVRRLDPGLRRPLRPRRRRHRAGDDRADRRARAGRARLPPGTSELPERPHRSTGLLRLAAAARGDDDRRLRRHRRLPVLRVLRGHAVPMYFLIGRFGGPRRQYAAMKFFLYSLLGGLLMLAVGDRPVRGRAAASSARAPSTAPRCASSTSIPESTQMWLFPGFFIAFAIKAPLVPLHTWLPDAGAEAPVGGAVLLVGVLDKVGTFGFLRYCLPLFPRRVARLRAAGPRAVGDRHPLRRAAGGRAERHEAVRRLHLDRALRLHRAGHLRLHHRRRSPARCSTWSTTASRPACCSWWSACSIARGGSRQIGDYGGVAKVAPLLGGLFLLAGLAVAGAAGHELVRQRVPGADRLVPARAGVRDPRDRRHHPRRALRAVGLPATMQGPVARRCCGAPTTLDDVRAAARRWRPRRSRRIAAPASPAPLPACSTSSGRELAVRRAADRR